MTPKLIGYVIVAVIVLLVETGVTAVPSLMIWGLSGVAVGLLWGSLRKRPARQPSVLRIVHPSTPVYPRGRFSPPPSTPEENQTCFRQS